MKFTNIPKNGASWGGELRYSFSTELDEPSDVVVVVRDADTNEELGEMQLYSVTEGTVDIAPIVRRQVSVAQPSTNYPTIIFSRSVVRVVVEVEGVASPAVSLFRSSYTPSLFKVLSSMSDAEGVAIGDTLRYTVNVVGEIAVTATEFVGGKSRQIANLSFSALSQIVEVVVPIASLSKDADRVVVTISSGAVSKSSEYRVVERTAGSRTLLWYNSRGGIERYAFPYSRQLSRTADVTTVKTLSGRVARLNAAECRVRLSSALLSLMEQERLSEIILSPYLFEDVAGKVSEVELASREINYDQHGALQRLSLDIVEEWKGGKLW